MTICRYVIVFGRTTKFLDTPHVKRSMTPHVNEVLPNERKLVVSYFSSVISAEFPRHAVMISQSLHRHFREFLTGEKFVVQGFRYRLFPPLRPFTAASLSLLSTAAKKLRLLRPFVSASAIERRRFRNSRVHRRDSILPQLRFFVSTLASL